MNWPLFFISAMAWTLTALTWIFLKDFTALKPFLWTHFASLLGLVFLIKLVASMLSVVSDSAPALASQKKLEVAFWLTLKLLAFAWIGIVLVKAGKSDGAAAALGVSLGVTTIPATTLIFGVGTAWVRSRQRKKAQKRTTLAER